MKTNNWEEEFDNIFGKYLKGKRCIGKYFIKNQKSFISNLLSDQRKEIVDCLPKELEDVDNDLTWNDTFDNSNAVRHGFNEYRKQAIDIIKKYEN